MTDRHLRNQLLDTHRENLIAQKELINVGQYILSDRVDGNESFFTLTVSASELGVGLLSVGKWVSGLAVKTLSAAMGAAGNQLTKTFAENDVFIKQIIKRLDNKDSHSFNINSNNLMLMTAHGDKDLIKEDMVELLRTLKLFNGHQKDIVDFHNKQLMVVNKLSGKLTLDLILKVMEEYETLSHPTFKLPNQNQGTYTSNILPGNKLFEFKQTDSDEINYTMRNDESSNTVSSTELTLEKHEVKELLNLLSQINGVFKDIKNSYESYLTFIKSWSRSVGSVSKSLDNSSGISKSVLNAAEGLLKGNPNILAFYSGFTPRVVNYVDRYINTAINVFA